MLEKFSIAVVSRLKSDGVIEESIEDIYVYGVQVMMSNLIGIISSLLIGIMFSALVEVIVFLVSFIITRRFTGGFHASNSVVCFLITCLSVIVAIAIGKYCYIPSSVCITVGVISTLVVIFLAPIENKNKILTDGIKKRCKFFSIVLSLLQCILMVILKYLNVDAYKMLFVSLFLITASMIIPALTERRNRNEEGCIQEDC